MTEKTLIEQINDYSRHGGLGLTSRKLLTAAIAELKHLQDEVTRLSSHHRQVVDPKVGKFIEEVVHERLMTWDIEVLTEGYETFPDMMGFFKLRRDNRTFVTIYDNGKIAVEGDDEATIQATKYCLGIERPPVPPISAKPTTFTFAFDMPGGVLRLTKDDVTEGE